MAEKILGVIAGNGKFPVALARRARENQFKVIAAGIRGDTTVFLRYFVDKIEFFSVGELKRLFSYFEENGVKQAIMAGQVNPGHLFNSTLALDDDFKDLFKAIEDRRADTIFSAVADKLKERQIDLIDSTFLLKDNLAKEGVLTNRHPNETELIDINFGKEIAKAMGAIDIGQTVIVKEKAIVAIEAMEGTDNAIKRGGRIAHRNAVVVKMSKPNQDLRFDVPVIGSRTIKTMIKAKAGCLAVEAGKTLIIDPQRTLLLANQANISIVAV